MAFCVLWCAVVLTCVLCCYGGEDNMPSPPWKKTDLPLSSVEKPESGCDKYIRFPNSGNNTSFTVVQYLSSKDGVGCTNAISDRLRNIFSSGEESAKIRADLERQLGNVCSAFVNIISVIAFNNDAMSGGICEGSLLDDSSVDANFCEKVKKIIPEEQTSLKSNIESFQNNFKWASSAAEGVTTLQDLDTEGCTEKCGEGYSKVLCNAYYSIAVLFSQEFPVVLQARSEEWEKIPPSEPADTTDSPPTDLSPTDLPSSDTLSDPKPSKTLIAAIQKLLAPLLSLEKNRFTLLLHLDGSPVGKDTAASTWLDLSSEQKEALDSVEDFKQLVRMVYVVKVAGDKLRVLPDEAFDLLAKTSDNLMLSVPKAVFDDLKSMLGDDLGAVMIDVRTYKDKLFAEATDSHLGNLASSPSGESEFSSAKPVSVSDQPPPPKEQIPWKHSPNSQPQPSLGQLKPGESQDIDSQDSESQGGKFQDNKPHGESKASNADSHDLQPEPTTLPPYWTTDLDYYGDGTDGYEDDEFLTDSDTAPLPLNPEEPEVDKDLEILTPLKNSKTFLALLQEVDSGGTKMGMADEARNKLINSLVESLKLENKAALFAKLKEPELREKLGVKITEQQDAVPTQEDDLEEDAASRFGAFHFLGLFLLVGGAVVVGYLCLHNKKKIREGVGSYMTSDSKRRRARKYKPLATSEA